MLSANEYVRGTLVPKSLLEPLGYLSIWFSLLEQNLNVALRVFLDLDEERGNLIAAQFNSFSVKLDLLKNLAETQIVDPHCKAQLNDIINRMRSTNTERNKIVHGHWRYTLRSMIEPERVYKYALNRHGEHKQTSFDKAHILDVANNALDAAVRLETILQEMPRVRPKDWPGTSPETP